MNSRLFAYSEGTFVPSYGHSVSKMRSATADDPSGVEDFTLSSLKVITRNRRYCSCMSAPWLLRRNGMEMTGWVYSLIVFDAMECSEALSGISASLGDMSFDGTVSGMIHIASFFAPRMSDVVVYGLWLFKVGNVLYLLVVLRKGALH
jgi:hypothetical protein